MVRCPSSAATQFPAAGPKESTFHMMSIVPGTMMDVLVLFTEVGTSFKEACWLAMAACTEFRFLVA